MYEIAGIGMDLCEIERARKILENRHFLERVLTPAERAYLLEKGASAAQSLAAIWAGKEAAVKALGCGIAFPLTEIEILPQASGQPMYHLSGQAKSLCGEGRMHLSLTHEGNMAGAFCVWEKPSMPADPMERVSEDRHLLPQ